jgi:uncharacterized protein (TIGR02172 family)
MNKGKFIGKGKTAEVFEWGQDRVLKLFFDRYDDERIAYEANIGNMVHEAGVPSPAVFDRIKLDSRKGIIFQRIFGKTIKRHIAAEPWNLYRYEKQMARLHFKIHKCSIVGMLSQKERFAITIGRSSKILGYKKKRILDYVESLPDGDSICHGDFHFNNILVQNKELVAVDWNSAYTGNPLGDVARTLLMLNSKKVLSGIPDIKSTPSEYSNWLTYQSYLKEYMRLSKVKFEDIDAWILPVAAAKLKDKRPGDETWLMDIINKRLGQLDV